jgi:hypothetical protein
MENLAIGNDSINHKIGTSGQFGYPYNLDTKRGPTHALL